MSQHARPVGPTTTNAQAPFVPSMVQGTAPPAQLVQRCAHIGPRPVGWSTSQTTHVQAAYVPPMGQGVKPDRPRLFKAPVPWLTPPIAVSLALNIRKYTEQFENVAEWTPFSSLTVTANTHPPPGFADPLSSNADTLTDADGAAFSGIESAYTTVSDDSSAWVTSLYIRKDAITTRFVEVGMQFVNGSGIYAAISVDTSAGLIANAADGAPDASGIDDVDVNWWRVWLRKANNGTGNTNLRMLIFPAKTLTLGAADWSPTTGSAIVWGANQTNSSAVQAYQPDPDYTMLPEHWTGWYPDRPRLSVFPRHVGWIAQPPQVDAFSIEMIRGSLPERARIFLAPKIPLPWSQTTHVAATFTPDMVAGSHLDRFREFLPVRLGWRVAPDAQNDAAAFSVEMAQGAKVDRYRELMPARPGWITSQTTHVDARFGPEMVGGHHPDRNREILPLRVAWSVSQPTHVAAGVSLEMLAGWHPDRATFDRRVPVGWLAQTPDVALFSIEMVRGSLPERGRLLLGARIPLPLSQTTHVQAAFTIDMIAGSKPDRARPFVFPKIGHSDSQVTFLVQMTPEMFAGSMPTRSRALLGARIPLPWSQTTHVQNAFTIDMVKGTPGERSRERLAPRTQYVAYTTDIVGFTIEHVQGSHPDQPRIFLAPRIMTTPSQLTHVEARFGPEMVSGAKPDRYREFLPLRIGWISAQTTPIAAAFSPEMAQGSVPEKNRAFIYPKLGEALSQTTHVEAAFTADMVQGSQPERPRLFIHPNRAWMPTTWMDFPGVFVPATGDVFVTIGADDYVVRMLADDAIVLVPVDAPSLDGGAVDVIVSIPADTGTVRPS